MKKLFKLSSVVLAILIVMSTMTSVNVFATKDDPRLTVGNGSSYGIDIGVSSSSEIRTEILGNLQSKGFTALSAGAQTLINASIAPFIMKLPIPEMEPGKKLEKYVMRFAFNKTTDAWDSKWVFKKVPNVSSSSWKLDEITAAADANDGNAKCTLASTHGKIITVDVSTYAKECYMAGLEHFYVAGYNTLGTSDIHISPSSTIILAQGFNSDDLLQYAYYTQSNADSFNYVGITSPESTNDDLVLEFTNPVDETTVTSNMFTVKNLAGENEAVQESEITVSGNKIILNKGWEGYGYYEVAFNGEIKDIYNQALNVSTSTNFEIGVSTTSSTVTPEPLAYICTGEGSDTEGAYDTPASQNDYINGNKRYTIMQFDIDDVVADKQVIGAELSFYCNDGRKFANFNKLACVPEPNFATASGTDTTYLSIVSGIFGNSSNLIDYTTPGTSAAGRWTADVSDAVSNVILDANKTEKKITFALYLSTGAWRVYGSSHTNKPTLKLKLAEKSLDAISTLPAKGAAMNGVGDKIELTLAAVLADENYIELRNASNNENIEIDVDSDGSKYTIIPKTDLEERTEYLVVLKNGATDKSGEVSVSGGDKVIHRFTSGTALQFKEIKFTDDKAPVSYEDANKIELYASSDAVTAVAEVFNGSSKDLPAIMIIALYDSDGSLVKVDADAGEKYYVPGGETVLYTKTIEVPSDAQNTYIQAFVWSGLENIRPICEHQEINQQN